MRILYITQYFVTPDQPGSLRHYAHAKEWARRGHDVVMVCTYVLHKKSEIPAVYQGKRHITERVEGCTVHKLYSRPSFSGFRGRMANYLSFMWRAILAGVRERGAFDVVIASSPSLFVGIAGAVVARWKSTPFVLEVRDLWPQSAIVTGHLSHPAIIWLARFLERRLYARASAVIAVTAGIAKTIRACIPRTTPVELVPNGVDEELFHHISAPHDSELQNLLASIDVPIAVYAGSHGVNNALDRVIQAAELLRDERVRFLLIGQDDQTEMLRQAVRAAGLDSVLFTGAIPRLDIPWVLSRASVALWPVNWTKADSDLRALKQGVLPNKLFDYVASGKPIVTSVPVPSEAATRLREWKAIVVYVSPSAEAIAQGVRDALRLAPMQEVDRKSFIESNSRRCHAERLERVLLRVAGGGGS